MDKYRYPSIAGFFGMILIVILLLFLPQSNEASTDQVDLIIELQERVTDLEEQLTETEAYLFVALTNACINRMSIDIVFGFPPTTPEHCWLDFEIMRETLQELESESILQPNQ